MHKLSYLYSYINDFSFYLCFFIVFILYARKKQSEIRLLDLCFEKTQFLRSKHITLYYLLSREFCILLSAYIVVKIYELSLSAPDTFINNDEYFTYANYFSALFFGPLFAIPVMIISGMDFRKTLDTFSPIRAIDLFLGKIACYFGGCCYGIECNFGLYMPERDRIEFPIQFTEAFVGLLIAVFLFICLKKGWFKNMLYPFFMVLYSGTRFFTEFLRGDHDPIWFGLRPYQVLCIVGVIIGGAFMLGIHLLDKHGKLFLKDTNLVDYIIKKYKEKKASQIV